MKKKKKMALIAAGLCITVNSLVLTNEATFEEIEGLGDVEALAAGENIKDFLDWWDSKIYDCVTIPCNPWTVQIRCLSGNQVAHCWNCGLVDC